MASLSPVNVRPVLTIAAGGSHTCVLLGSAVQCWGANYYGQLGLGDTSTSRVSDGRFVLLGSQVIAIDAGMNHTCALLPGGSIQCWGYNGYGQLGTGDKKNRGDNTVLPLAVVKL